MQLRQEFADQIIPFLPETGIVEVDAEGTQGLDWGTATATGEKVEIFRNETLSLLLIAAVEGEGDEFAEDVGVAVKARLDEVADVAPTPAVGLDHLHLRAEELAILGAPQSAEIVGGEEPLVQALSLFALLELVSRGEVRVSQSRQFGDILVVARATREHPEIELGASPRATLALYWASQAWAAIHGRDFVLPDDIKFMAPHVLTHRLMSSPQAQLRGRLPHELVADIVEVVPVPVED